VLTTYLVISGQKLALEGEWSDTQTQPGSLKKQPKKGKIAGKPSKKSFFPETTIKNDITP
jgi:hypothetical protein